MFNIIQKTARHFDFSVTSKINKYYNKKTNKVNHY